MKADPGNIAARCLVAAVALVLLVCFGPWLIHRAYRLATPRSVEQSERKRYNDLANAEAFDKTLSPGERMRMRREREQLFYWFHARGWGIDEGDEEAPWFKPWRELFRHWRGPA